MVILITGASHTGKTALAQKLLEQYGFPYLSIDHLKMGLIRSGNTALTPMDSTEALTEYLWPIVREMVKTAIENGQNLIVEGCYIPFNWQKGFDESYRKEIRFLCLVMSKAYIRAHFVQIKGHANTIEQRLDDSGCTAESLLRNNEATLRQCREHSAPYILINSDYEIDMQEGLNRCLKA